MKLLVFGGGLGNQIFEYAFYLYAKGQYKNSRLIGYYPRKLLSEHYGLELNRWFNVSLPQETWFSGIMYNVLRILRKLLNSHSLIDDSTQSDNSLAYVIFALKTNRQYFPHSAGWLEWKVAENGLSNMNKNVLKKIRSTESFFVHIRRGDYLSSTYYARFQGTCTVLYYNSALSVLLKNNPDANFFVFSDDMAWVKDNLIIKNRPVTYIDWNLGADSPLDMYLMSQCMGGIIANSTFSYWAAHLGVDKKDIYYPSHWFAPGFEENDLYYKPSWTKIDY